MTEEQWHTHHDADSMVVFLGDKASARKLRLHACSCCRRIWGMLDSDCRCVVEMAERFADGLIDEELLSCWRQLSIDRLDIAQSPLTHVDTRFFEWGPSEDGVLLDRYLHSCGLNAQEARTIYAMSLPIAAVVKASSQLWSDSRGLGGGEADHYVARTFAGVCQVGREGVSRWWQSYTAQRDIHAQVFRHLVGNPFRPYPAPTSWPSTVVKLAEAMYAGEYCSFALHDALLEAGHPELAEHFREKDHPKGCWAMDVILGKS